MKRITALLLAVMIICGMMTACKSGNSHKEPTESTEVTEAAAATSAATEIPMESSPIIVEPNVPIETIPKNPDDADYSLPPGETPTFTPELS